MQSLDTLRHSMAHILAYALNNLYPNVKLAIGPTIENGFYYDLSTTHTISLNDFTTIENEMAKIIKQNLNFERKEISKAEALNLFANNLYKTEIINDLPNDATISIYTIGDFVDLCRGPHVSNTSELANLGFKLLNVAGAYWRGNEKNDMLQRIYATAFENHAKLEEYLAHREALEKNDHRRIGKELSLFSFHEEAGPGLCYWHPMGARMRLAIENFWRDQHIKNGYEMVYTPHIGKSWLWETSGHLDFYKDGMYSSMKIDDDDYYAKPMNCPFHAMIYNEGKKSYRDLPLRWCELGTVYRYERSGTLHGLMRVRGFTQDDAHIICTPDQVEDEVKEVLRFSLFMLRTFKFAEIKAFISTRPEKAIGDPKDWKVAEDVLKKVVADSGLEYQIDEGGGAFYGPKIDLKVKDSMGREWQLTTIQFDWNLTERFNMTFVDKDGKEKRPYMLHRALFGSIERFFGVLLEHFGGTFPAWLAPVQATIVPVSDSVNDYAKEILTTLKGFNFRANIDDSDDRMGAKIRKANQNRVPFTIIVGEKDREAKAISIKILGEEEQKNLMPLGDAIIFMNTIINSKN